IIQIEGLPMLSPLPLPRWLILACALALLGACSSHPEEEPLLFDFGEPDALEEIDGPDAFVEPDVEIELVEDVFEIPQGSVDGEACDGDLDCRGGTCIDSPDWQDGYCTTLSCTNFEDCASDGEDNRCFQAGGGQNFCVRMCTQHSDCREGYICRPIGYGSAFCAPNPSVDPDFENLEDYPFEVICQNPEESPANIEFEIAEETVAYMITPIARDGDRLRPNALYDEDDTRIINFRGENGFQAVTASLFGYVSPLIVPAAPQFTDQLKSGHHRLAVNTRSEELCHYLLQAETFGTRIDLNIYLAGVRNIDAASAAENANMQTVLAKFEEMYEQAGIEIGTVTFHDITGEDATRFSVIRSDTDVARLVALSKRPDDEDLALSMNIFFVSQFAFSDGGGAIGISMGLPGPAGLHGTPASGVVFTSEYMGREFRERGFGTVDGNEFTGIVLAHEVGHYLGLFHTTEQSSQGFDPLEDTPECREGFPSSCPDLGNMMFPLASIGNIEVTPDQAFVIGVNPLTKD
ncbi:MAG: hypothetical protein ACNA8W_20145, partial [Bradymonadaceae bacterium]